MQTKLLSLRILRLLVEALDAVAVIGFPVFVVPPLLTIVNRNFTSLINPVQRRLDPFEAPLVRLVHHLPHQFGATDATPYIIGVAMLFASFALAAFARRLRVQILALKELQKVAEAEEAARLANVAGRLAAIEAGSPSQREKVLEVYAQAKRILDGQKRRMAFLAVDVVNSTGMKHGEDPALAERDFRQYRKLVESCISEHRGLKSAWTPDGVMICFSDLEEAVRAGQALIRGLHNFNLTVKSIRADFKVRCGINAGEILYDDSLKMEEMSDESIDLAGHMQKYADPNTIYAPRVVLAGRAEHLGFRPLDKKVDGRDVSAWIAG